MSDLNTTGVFKVTADREKITPMEFTKAHGIYLRKEKKKKKTHLLGLRIVSDSSGSKTLLELDADWVDDLSIFETSCFCRVDTSLTGKNLLIYHI